MELPIVFNNRYQLVKKIGEGRLSEVYQAQDMAALSPRALSVLGYDSTLGKIVMFGGYNGTFTNSNIYLPLVVK